jgi:hypothetical protein
VIFTPHHIHVLFGDQIKNNEMGGHVAYTGERCIQCLGRET